MRLSAGNARSPSGYTDIGEVAVRYDMGMLDRSVAGDKTIFTLDSNFRIYRPRDGGVFKIVPEQATS